MSKPEVYQYGTFVDPSADPADFGWWFQCCPCPSEPGFGGTDKGPYETAAAANDAARMHLLLHGGVSYATTTIEPDVSGFEAQS